VAQAQLVIRQRELVNALKTLRVRDEIARRIIKQRLIKEAKRDRRRKGQRETRSNITLVVNKRPKSSVA